MFSKTDFWIGLAVGAVAGVFGYRFMQERTQQLAALEAGQTFRWLNCSARRRSWRI